MMEYNQPKKLENDAAQSVTSVQIKLLVSGIVCITMALLLLNIDFIQVICNLRSQLKNGSEIFRELERENIGLHISLYLYNVTNADEFLRGKDKKLKLQEVGPFTYVEIRSHDDLEVDEEAGLLKYSPKTRVEFSPEESIAHPKDVHLIMPNIALLGMSSMVSTQGIFMTTAFNVLLQHLGSKPIVNLTAQEILWGFDEPIIKLGNTVLPGWISFEKLGILDRLYDDRREYKLEVASSVHEKFKLKTMNGLGGLKAWSYEDPTKRTKCNTFDNTFEGIMYPNEMLPGAPIRIYRNLMCRQLELDYQGLVTMSTGAEVYHYKVSKTAYEINNYTDCLCEKGLCVSGISDLSPCYYNLPLAMSNPHFLYADPALYERIDGMNPSEEKHGSEFLIDWRAGMALKTSFSTQINLVLKNVDFSARVSPFSDMVVPVCYLKISHEELSDKVVFNLRLAYSICPYIITALEVVLSLAGIAMVGYSIHLLLSRLAINSKEIVFGSPNDNVIPEVAMPLLRFKYIYRKKM